MYVLVEFEDDDGDEERYREMTTGLAFALNGTVFYGDSSSAGEFKSFLCRNPSNEQFSIDYRTRLKMKSDSVIQSEFLHELSRNIAFTANILNLSHVFLGGNLDTQSSELSDLIQKEANINWLYSDEVNLELVFSRSDEHPAAIGAAGLALERLFEIPFIQVSAIVKEVFSFMLE